MPFGSRPLKPKVLELLKQGGQWTYREVMRELNAAPDRTRECLDALHQDGCLYRKPTYDRDGRINGHLYEYKRFRWELLTNLWTPEGLRELRV